MSVIDAQGYRANVGIILINEQRRLFWGRRLGQSAWQFPQGGLLPNESLEEGLYRELHEEIGLTQHDVEIIAITKHWLKYVLPQQFVRHHLHPLCIGQKQKWVLLKLITTEEKISLNQSQQPEFDRWRWVSYWYPINHVIDFKKNVYKKALQEFAPFVFE